MKKHVLYILFLIYILLLVGCGKQPDRYEQLTQDMVPEKNDGLWLDTDETARLYQQSAPYVADVNTTVGAVYQVPEEEFENVIMMHFAIDKETEIHIHSA